MQSMEAAIWESEKHLHAKLRKGGLSVNMGSEGQGLFSSIHERGGGYSRQWWSKSDCFREYHDRPGGSAHPNLLGTA